MLNINTSTTTKTEVKVAVMEKPAIMDLPVGQIVHYKKDGTVKKFVQNKKAGVKSEVEAIHLEDLVKILMYMEEHEMWLAKLWFVFSCNTARRAGDTLSITWRNIFDPKTGEFRRNMLAIREDKTNKFSAPAINNCVQKEILNYIEKTHCDVKEMGIVSYNDKDGEVVSQEWATYGQPVFKQLTGNYKGRVLTVDACRKILKKVAQAVGITYNVGTHSCRKTFGMLCMRLHKDDSLSMETLREIYNHANVRVTSRYIGQTQEKVNTIYDDTGIFFDNYVNGDGDITDITNGNLNQIFNQINELIKNAMQTGWELCANGNTMGMLDAYNDYIEATAQLKSQLRM